MRAARGPGMTRFSDHPPSSGQRSFLCAFRVLRGPSPRLPTPDSRLPTPEPRSLPVSRFAPSRLRHRWLPAGLGISQRPNSASSCAEGAQRVESQDLVARCLQLQVLGEHGFCDSAFGSAQNDEGLGGGFKRPRPVMPMLLHVILRGRSSRLPTPDSRLPTPEPRAPSPESRVPSPEIFPVRASLHPGDKGRHPGRGVAAIRDPLSIARHTNNGEDREAQINSRVPRCARPQDDEVPRSPAFFRATLIPLRFSRPSRTISPTPDSRLPTPDSRLPTPEIFPDRASLHPGDKGRHPGRGVRRDPGSIVDRAAHEYRRGQGSKNWIPGSALRAAPG